MTSIHHPTNTFDEKVGRTIEEIGEVMVEAGKLLHALGKAQRHGWTPSANGVDYDNAADAVSAINRLNAEIADLHEMLYQVMPELQALRR
jgi:hypothetical protein